MIRHLCSFSLMLFYMCQCGFYVYSIGALIAWETRRKDFSVMMSHHIVTTILITYSYLTRYILCKILCINACICIFAFSVSFLEKWSVFWVSCRFFRIGMIILALHDTSDVFLEAAKLFKYSEKEVAASACFGLFAISWLFLRLIYFPFWIIRTSRYYSVSLSFFLLPLSSFLSFWFLVNLILFDLALVASL